MSDKSKTYAIIGGGLAGFSAARSLRLEGFDGRILFFGEELEAPYERPPLSKDRLRGEISPERVRLELPNYYKDHAIDLQLGERVVRVDPSDRVLELSGGRRIAYDNLLVATGSSLRRIDVPGHDLEGILYLRTLAECDALRARLQRHPRVLIVGTGFIGCEVAASARLLGCEVTLTGPELPLAHVLGSELGQIYARYHSEKGVTVRTGARASAFNGAGRVERATFTDGSTIDCDLVVLGIGVTPNVDVVKDHVQIDDGIVTDECCRTNVEGIFAAGDVANSWRSSLGRRARLEHFDNALRQGETVAKSMIGKPEVPDTVPFFYSDQYDLSLLYRGSALSWDRVVIRGAPSEHSFSAFYLKDREIRAVCSVNRYAESVAGKRLLHRQIDESVLRDESIPVDQFPI